jgi:hypothetical protein
MGRYTLHTTPEEDQMLAFLADRIDLSIEEVLENMLKLMLQAYKEPME